MENVSVDSEGRAYPFGQEVSAFVVDERFHFFEEALPTDEWERARAFYQLPKTKYRSTKSHGVRRGLGHIVGIAPKRPIKDIQDERGKEAGEKSGRMPAYGKAFERLVANDMAAREDTPWAEGDDVPF